MDLASEESLHEKSMIDKRNIKEEERKCFCSYVKRAQLEEALAQSEQVKWAFR